MIALGLQGYTPYSLAVSGYHSEFFQKTKKQVIHQCRVWVKQSNLRFEMMTFVFFRTVGFFFPYLSYQCEAMFGHLQALYLRFRAAQERALLQNEISQLTQDNRSLNRRMQSLLETIAASVPATQQAIYKNNEATREIETLTEQRKQLLFDRAPVLAERDRLAKENSELRAERDQLIMERNLACEEKNNAEGRCNYALEKLQGLQLSFDRMEDYRVLSEQLDRFQELYLQSQKNGLDEKGMTQQALDELIPCYKEHREKLHVTLDEVIQQLPQDSVEEVCLKGILRISKEETLHLERISQTLQLIEGLRFEFSKYFEPAARK